MMDKTDSELVAPRHARLAMCLSKALLPRRGHSTLLRAVGASRGGVPHYALDVFLDQARKMAVALPV